MSHIDPAEAGERPSGDILRDLGFGVEEPVGSDPPSVEEQIEALGKAALTPWPPEDET